jgi:hypothetical protein
VTRYRQLFRPSSEAVLVIDGLSQKVLEKPTRQRLPCAAVHAANWWAER